jgi:hypothetical protein
MDEKLSRETYLARAEYAEQQAARAKDEGGKQWLFVAATYRKLAEDAPPMPGGCPPPD